MEFSKEKPIYRMLVAGCVLRSAGCALRGTGCELYTSSEFGVLVAGYKEQAEGTGRKVNEFFLIFKKTERSDIYKYSICNLQSSIPACPG
jgi:hypothetical protein